MDYIIQLAGNPVVLFTLAIAALLLLIVILITSAARREGAISDKLEVVERSMAEKFDGISVRTDEQTLKNREELSSNLRGMGDSVTRIMGEMARTQQAQLDAFASQLREMGHVDEQRIEHIQRTVETRLMNYEDRMDRVGDILEDRLGRNVQHIDQLRIAIEQRMENLQRDNSIRLQQIEHTVDEQLSSTIDRRLNESFQQVSERLERVYQGLGEMQMLADGVGDLKRVLQSVRTRGSVGEVQLGALLRQLMSNEQYESDVRVRPNGARVAYAINLPGQSVGEEGCLLPVDTNLPHETYDQLVDALERGERKQIEQLGQQLEQSIRKAAMRANSEFVNPPTTTDFCVLFMGSEGLYAEALRRPGMVEALQREYRVILAGPSTMSALINCLLMGMKTWMLERRSEEVWSLLGAVKGEIATFAEALQRTQKRIRQASESIEDAAHKSRIIQRKLHSVDQVEGLERRRLLADDLFGAEDDEDEDWN